MRHGLRNLIMFPGGGGGGGTDGGWSNVAVPDAAFSYVPFAIQKNGNSFRADPTFDLRTYSGVDSASGTDYYVDPVTGSDDGGAFDGSTWAKAFKSIDQAVPDAKNARIIYCRPGIYGPTLTGGYYVDGGWLGVLGNKCKALICIGGQAVLTPRILQSYAASSSHYDSASTTAITSVMDTSLTNADGSYKKYTLAANEAGVDLTAGTFYWAANVLHVHTIDDRAPDTNIYALKSLANGLTSAATTTKLLYMENCKILFCADRMVRLYQNGIDGSGRLSAYFKNCVFSHQQSSPNSYDTFDVDGGVDTICQDCTCEYGKVDGFNYHQTPFTQQPTGVEINCIARYMGINGATENGSTSHELAPVVRIMGNYSYSWGANIGDVGGCKTWNLGCEVHHSLTATTTRKVGMLCGDGGGTTIWADSCYSHDNTKGLYAIESRTIYKRNMRGDADGGDGSGTITAY